MRRTASAFAISATLLFPALALPARAPAAEASEPDRGAASQHLVRCLHDAVPRLDDGRSDAATIAKGALGVCRQEIVSVFRASGAADPQGMADQQSALGTFEQIATALTLERRVAQSSAHRSQHPRRAKATVAAIDRRQAHDAGVHGQRVADNKAHRTDAAVRSPTACQHYPYCS
jgi:hypothetical protein